MAPDGELLVTHQSFSHQGRTYVAPFKAVDADEEGTLRLKWWAPNDRLQGAQVPLGAPTSQRVAWLKPEVDKPVGMMIVATFRLPPAPTPGSSANASATCSQYAEAPLSCSPPHTSSTCPSSMRHRLE